MHSQALAQTRGDARVASQVWPEIAGDFTVRGVVFKGKRELEVMQFDTPAPGHGEVLLRMKASGMCGSDLNFYRAESPSGFLVSQGFKSFAERGLADDTPIIAGHEPCGVIEELGAGVDPAHFRVGDRVMVYHYEGCNVCECCHGGWTQMCDSGAVAHGTMINGGHADFMRAPVACLVKLPDEISFVAGAAIACGTGTAFGALLRLGVTARDTLAIFGLGPVGLAAVQLAAAMGVRVIGVDVDESRVSRAMSLGAAHAINATNADPVSEIHKLTAGRGAECAIDCAGGEIAKQNAVRCTAPWGRIALVAVGGNLNLVGWGDLIKKQRTVVGSYTFSIGEMSRCARFIAERGVEADRVFTDHWDISDAAQAYAAFDRQASGKGVFVFE